MSDDAIPFDTVLGLCEDRHRRIILGTLLTENRSLTVNDLTKAIAKHNHHEPVTELSAERLSKLQTSLHHLHLPKIAASGLIHYDQERGLVEPTGQVEQVRAQISAVIEADPGLESPVAL